MANRHPDLGLGRVLEQVIDGLPTSQMPGVTGFARHNSKTATWSVAKQYF
ncbi:MAG TPA: hypothetical protein VIS72_12390 [Anaerolineales bacterium]